jgi:hypothetical protein
VIAGTDVVGHPDGGAGGRNQIRIPISQIAVRSPRLDHFEDLAQTVTERRIRRRDDVFGIDDETVSMCTMVRAEGGGPLRTFNGGLWHENGWHTSRKAGRLVHWEGETALWQLLQSETDHQVAKLASENVSFEFVHEGRRFSYTPDIEQTDPAGYGTLIEVKRDDRDLDDPEYRLKLAYVREVCRRCGIAFRVVFRKDIFRSPVHRRNVSLFASRGFVVIGDQDLAVLADHRRSSGGVTTYGELAQALAPGHAATGRALVQGMLVRRLLSMDLTSRLHDASPITIG